MNNILIECSQKNSNNVLENGVWETILPVPITLENGDAFALSKSFIDNEIEADGIINIKDDLFLTIGCYAYIMNDDSSKFDSTQDENATEIDNGPYIIYDIVKPPTIENTPLGATPIVMEEITEIEFLWNRKDFSQAFFGDLDGEHPLKFIAETGSSPPQKFPVFVNVPKTRISNRTGSWENFVKVEVSILCRKIEKNFGGNDINVSLVPDNTDGSWVFNQLRGEADDPGAFNFIITKTSDKVKPNKDILFPKQFSKNIFLPQGKYEPTQLTTLINDKLNNNTFPSSTITGLKNVLNTPFLHQAAEFNFGKATGDQILIPANPVFGSLPSSKGGSKGIVNRPTDPTKPYKTNFFIGSNLIELQFSSDLNKFYWNFLHFPIYSKDTGNPIITKILPTTTGTNVDPDNQKFIQQGKNGGIFFYDLSANKESETGERVDFWSKVLGFNLGSLIPNSSLKVFTPGLHEYTAPIFTLLDGIHTTNAGNILDAVVDKTDYNKFNQTESFAATNDFNNVIYATSTTFGNGILDTGYYLIEIQLNFSSNIVGAESITKNISGIVNRYYSKGSYVSGGGDPSFVINFRGETILITSMKIRILNPNKSVASVGEDNTLFFEIVKQLEPTI